MHDQINTVGEVTEGIRDIAKSQAVEGLIGRSVIAQKQGGAVSFRVTGTQFVMSPKQLRIMCANNAILLNDEWRQRLMGDVPTAPVRAAHPLSPYVTKVVEGDFTPANTDNVLIVTDLDAKVEPRHDEPKAQSSVVSQETMNEILDNSTYFQGPAPEFSWDDEEGHTGLTGMFRALRGKGTDA